jgi:hypothetical protein
LFIGGVHLYRTSNVRLNEVLIGPLDILLQSDLSPNPATINQPVVLLLRNERAKLNLIPNSQILLYKYLKIISIIIFSILKLPAV